MMQFPRTPRRRTTPSGDVVRLWYSDDGRYVVAESKTCAGVPIPSPRFRARWLASPNNPLLSWHRTRRAAMAACVKHQRKARVKA